LLHFFTAASGNKNKKGCEKNGISLTTFFQSQKAAVPVPILHTHGRSVLCRKGEFFPLTTMGRILSFRFDSRFCRVDEKEISRYNKIENLKRI